MDTGTMDRLARVGDYSEEAAGIRARAAILAAGYSIASFGRASEQKPQAISNSLVGDSFPSRTTMLTLYKKHRIDPTFIITGDYGQLSSAMQQRIFDQLESLERAKAQLPD